MYNSDLFNCYADDITILSEDNNCSTCNHHKGILHRISILDLWKKTFI